MATVQAIFLAHEREQIEELKRHLNHLQNEVANHLSELERRERELEVSLNALRNAATDNQLLSQQLQTEIAVLERRAKDDSEGLVARLTPVLGELIGRKIRDNRDEMADALGLVMGEAIRVQIRDSRQSTIDALYPVIGSVVNKAVIEAVSDIQQSVDRRFRTTFGHKGFFRTLTARLRGISASELAMRDALPFEIRQIFLIQQETGLLIAHEGDERTADSDLISAMLTAIRDFVSDSFGSDQDEQLDEVQYGNQRIVIQGGEAVYLAVVFTGVELAGFHYQLREFVSELHITHLSVLRNYNGDEATLPLLQPKLSRLKAELGGEVRTARPIGRRQKLVIGGLGILALLFLGLSCFYLQFTIALLPVAFPSATPTNTPTLSITPTPPSAVTNGRVWVRLEPDLDAPVQVALEIGTPLTVYSVYGPWMEVEWFGKDTPVTIPGQRRGWMPSAWVDLNINVPAAIETPYP